jgi:hypothetical protein
MTATPITAITAGAHTRRSVLPAPATRSAGLPEARRDLRRLRWAVRATLTLGVVASVAANILHAHPNLISQIIAAWPPLALLLTVELISRVPTHRRALAVIRLAATAAIAGIAAWVSYWHMAGVAARYGETDAAASYLLPLSVDGLVIVASVSLVEITGRIQAADGNRGAMHLIDAAQRPAGGGGDDGEQASSVTSSVARRGSAPVAGAVATRKHATTPSPGRASGPSSARTAASNRKDHDDDAEAPPGTAAAVAYWRRRNPRLHPAEIAERIGRSERTVRRYWPSFS